MKTLKLLTVLWAATLLATPVLATETAAVRPVALVSTPDDLTCCQGLYRVQLGRATPEARTTIRANCAALLARRRLDHGE